MSGKDKVCVVSCSVLKEELLQLVKDGSLDVDLVFVSKLFHVDYELVEKNLRRVLEHAVKSSRKVVLVYGDLCLGPNGEMKQLAKEYGVAKVNAVNCVDCQLGGKGAFDKDDPEHNLMFMGPGMVEFFSHMKQKLQKEGLDEAAFKTMFSGIRGFVLLDTCGNAKKMRKELENSGLDVPILETRAIGLDGIKSVVEEAVKKASDSTT